FAGLSLEIVRRCRQDSLVLPQGGQTHPCSDVFDFWVSLGALRRTPSSDAYEIFFIDFTLLRAIDIPCVVCAERRSGCGRFWAALTEVKQSRHTTSIEGRSHGAHEQIDDADDRNALPGGLRRSGERGQSTALPR